MTIDREQAIVRCECPDCGAVEGWWHLEGCPHRPAPYSRVTNAIEVRYVREASPDPVADAAREFYEAATEWVDALTHGYRVAALPRRYDAARDALDAALNGVKDG